MMKRKSRLYIELLVLLLLVVFSFNTSVSADEIIDLDALSVSTDDNTDESSYISEINDSDLFEANEAGIAETRERTGLIVRYLEGIRYLVYPNGDHYTGWYTQVSSGYKFYYDPKNDGAAATGLTNIYRGAYLFNSDGTLNTTDGVTTYDGQKYWCTSSGRLKTGWYETDSAEMYFDPHDYCCATGTVTIDGVTYLFGDDGTLKYTQGTSIQISGFSLNTYLEAGRACAKYNNRSGINSVVYSVYCTESGSDDYYSYSASLTSDKCWTAWIDFKNHGTTGLYCLEIYINGVYETEQYFYFTKTGPDADTGSLPLDIAISYMGTPYYWAGYQPSTGFDCSGLVDWCYYLAGSDEFVRHTTASMITTFENTSYDVTSKGTTVDKLQVGDLIVTSTDSGRHVTIYAGNGMVIGANGGDETTYGDDPNACVKYATYESYYNRYLSGEIKKIYIFRVPVSVW